MSTSSNNRLQYYRLLTFLGLILNDGIYTVCRRYSRGVLAEPYSVNEVLLMGELIKTFFSVYMMSCSGSEGDGSSSAAEAAAAGGGGPVSWRRCRTLLVGGYKMLVLAGIYGLGNVLSYYALARVGKFQRMGMLRSVISGGRAAGGPSLFGGRALNIGGRNR